MKLNTNKIIGYGAAGLVVFLGGRKIIKEALGDAGQAINPVNNNNIFKRAVDAVGGAVSEDESWTLGGWVYDITHPNQKIIDVYEIKKRGMSGQ